MLSCASEASPGPAIIGLSQPAASAALKRLRHLLDDQLFVRRGNDMVPTPRAEGLDAAAREALAQIETALAGDKRFDPGSADRPFTLIGADFFSTLLMPSLSERLAVKAPHVKLRLMEIAMEPSSAMPDWISTETLFIAPSAIIIAKSHPAAAKRQWATGEFPLDLFCELPHAIHSVDGMPGVADTSLATVGRSTKVVLMLPHFQSVALAAAQGRLIAAVPIQLAQAVASSLDLAIYDLPVPVKTHDISSTGISGTTGTRRINGFGKKS
ncbi:LysR family transcriptional regulator [Microvirga makkahensis]|uniref:LysR family transcriptional regulator n=1 Tax=Microvirga makkahensis TaxID=1128670 RepID=UPI001FEB2655|nr:LysR family transcriptional regulator [Microvirga makkahensis]